MSNFKLNRKIGKIIDGADAGGNKPDGVENRTDGPGTGRERVGNEKRMEGQTVVYKWKDHFIYPTPLLIGVRTTLL
jgi:hypothetical protein